VCVPRILALPCAALFLAAALAAQTPTKIGVIQIQTALVSTKDGQKAVQELESRMAPKQREMERKRTELQELQDKLNKGGNAMAQAAKDDLARTIDQKTKSYNRDMEDARAELDTEQRKLLEDLSGKMQVAIDKLFSASATRFFGILEQYRYETLTFAALTRDGQHAHPIAPAQYRDVDIGNEKPVKCLNNGLWLCNADDLRYAVVLSFHREYGHESGTCVEIAARGRRKRVNASLLCRTGGGR